MIYLKVILGVVSVMCMVFVAFNVMDFLSWYYVNGKKVALIIFNWLRGFIK